jgi:hypothetical protein
MPGWCSPAMLRAKLSSFILVATSYNFQCIDRCMEFNVDLQQPACDATAGSRQDSLWLTSLQLIAVLH